MKIGKLPTELLEEKILSKIQPKRKDILVGAGIGEDCSAIDFGEDVCVLSTDPITGAAKGIGKLAIHISCNDIASNGIEPVGILLTILAPEDTSLEDIAQVIQEAKETARELNVEIIGGHTEVSRAVNKMVLSTTCIGKGKKETMITSHGACSGDDVFMTKWVGLEGTAILAQDKEEELREILSEDDLEKGKGYMKHLSVVPEGLIAGQAGATSMHDVTEGGLLGAVWELATASGVGIEIQENLIPLRDITKRICEYYKINPLGLISSGVMLITTHQPEKLMISLKKKNIPVTKIGKVIQGTSTLIKNGERLPLAPPESDELFKIIK